MLNKSKIILFLLFFVSILTAQVSEYEYKAAFIERFTRFVKWPLDIENNSFNNKFTIAVLGKNPFNTSLDDLFADLKIKGQSVNIIYTENIDSTLDVNLIFISTSEKKLIEKQLKIISNKPILIISDSPGFAEKGVHINMFNDGNYIKYEINKKAIEKAGLKVSSLQFASAKIVKSNE